MSTKEPCILKKTEPVSILFVQNSLDILIPEGSPAPDKSSVIQPAAAAQQWGWYGAQAPLAQWTMQPLGNRTAHGK